MSQKDEQERTEEPTAHKLKKAREEGNVAHSAEISSVLLMVIATVVIIQFGGWIYVRFEGLFETFFLNSAAAFDNRDNAMQYLMMACWYALEIMAPVLTALFVMAIVANMAQTGVVFATKVLEPKASRINPQNGFKKIFSMRGIVEMVKGFSKIFIVGLIIWFTLRTEMDNITSFLILPLGEIISQSGKYILLIVTRILAALVVLSIMDAAYARYQHRKELRMTKQEVKDEYKQMEGDPQMKSKRKQKALKLSQRKRLDHAVLSSEVVVTNPTHYAVALAYDPEINDAPIVRAKGIRKRALQIREYAEKYEVPVIENPPVARALYASAEEEEFVPPELYRAVAEILAYVYRLKNQNSF